MTDTVHHMPLSGGGVTRCGLHVHQLPSGARGHSDWTITTCVHCLRLRVADLEGRVKTLERQILDTDERVRRFYG